MKNQNSKKENPRFSCPNRFGCLAKSEGGVMVSYVCCVVEGCLKNVYFNAFDWESTQTT